MSKARIFWMDLLERVGATFVQGFIIAAFVVAGISPEGGVMPSFEELFSMAVLKGGIVGGVLALAKGFLAGAFGDRNSAALLPSPPDHAPGDGEVSPERHRWM